MRVLLAYSTSEGHTATIVGRLREFLLGAGHEVLTQQVADGRELLPEDVEGVIVGASVHGGRHQAGIRTFAKRHRKRLETMPSAFFQVCLTAADDSIEAVAETRAYVEEFTEATGWDPALVETFAGRLAFTHYDLFTRLVMRLHARQFGMPRLDTSRDYDYTDYGAVARFAERFAKGLERRA